MALFLPNRPNTNLYEESQFGAFVSPQRNQNSYMPWLYMHDPVTGALDPFNSQSFVRNSTPRWHH